MRFFVKIFQKVPKNVFFDLFFQKIASPLEKILDPPLTEIPIWNKTMT